MNLDSRIFTPLTIRGKTWKNRLVASPMIGLQGIEHGHLNAETLDQLRTYASGNPGEYIVGETDVSLNGYRGPAPMVYRWDDEENQNGMREYADLIHKTGAVAMAELSHAGESKVSYHGTEIYGPMDYIRESDGAHVHGMTEDDIQDTINDFVHAAQVCQNTGFDGVVLHGGHGWVFHQFLSSLTNQRTDRFGGSLENRLRILTMTMDAVRKSCGEDFIIECRLSGSENTGNEGYTLEEFGEICALLSRHCDILHVSAGMYRDPAETRMMSTIYDLHGCNTAFSEIAKKHADCVVSVVGGINSPALAEEILADGKADLVVMCRQWVADPAFVKKAQEGHPEEIRGCIRCMRCFPGPFESIVSEMEEAMAKGEPFRPFVEMHSCSVNPEYGCGLLSDKAAAEKSKRVLVVGGGCAGMQAAITAADRGHEVTLIEASDRLGGILNFAAEDTDKKDLYLLGKAMEAELCRKVPDVRLNTSFSADLLKDMKPDTVIAAVGSTSAVPPIPGLDGEYVLQGMHAYRRDQSFPEQVVILGGGTVGCETAVHIAKTGSRVTVVEMMDKLCPDAYRLHGIKVRGTMEKLNIRTCTGTTVTEVHPSGVCVKAADGEHFIAADLVINALGMKPVKTDMIRDACSGLEYYEIGDCVRARNIASALEEGYQTAVRL